MSESIIKQYYDGLKQGELRGMACRGCGKWTFPPTTACEHCGSSEVSIKTLSGKGKLLYASHGVAPPPNPRFNPYAPYVYGHIVLSEGVTVQAIIKNIRPTPEKLKEIFDKGPVDVKMDVLETADLPVLAFSLA